PHDFYSVFVQSRIAVHGEFDATVPASFSNRRRNLARCTHRHELEVLFASSPDSLKPAEIAVQIAAFSQLDLYGERWFLSIDSHSPASTCSRSLRSSSTKPERCSYRARCDTVRGIL